MAKNTVNGGNPVEPIHGFDGLTTGEVIQSSVLVKEGTDTPLPSDATRGLMVDLAGANLQDGRTTIATAGTAVQLNAGVAAKSVMVTALPTNTLRVAVGASTVEASDAGLRGIPLDPLEKVAIDVVNVNRIYLDVLGDGHGVTWVAIN